MGRRGGGGSRGDIIEQIKITSFFEELIEHWSRVIILSVPSAINAAQMLQAGQGFLAQQPGDSCAMN
jgi:hypothetical protein